VENGLFGLRSVDTVGKLIPVAFNISHANPKKSRPYPRFILLDHCIYRIEIQLRKLF
jgi:hypothetical protein